MAFLLINNPIRRRERIFPQRKRLADIDDHSLKDYRLPRHLITALADDFDRSEWSRECERGQAIPADTQVIKKIVS